MQGLFSQELSQSAPYRFSDKNGACTAYIKRGAQGLGFVNILPDRLINAEAAKTRTFTIYLISLLTLICAMLSAFQLAGFCFDRGKRRLCLFWTLSAVYFQSISLADAFKNGGGADKLSALGLWLLLALGAWQLLHARGAQRRVRPPLTLPDEAEPAAPSEAAQEAQELPDIREET